MPAATVAYTVFFFTAAVLRAGEQVEYASSSLRLVASVNDWSAAFAVERGVAYLVLQQDHEDVRRSPSSCPFGGQPIAPDLAWSAAMNTARLTASAALPAGCLATPPANLSAASVLARTCTDEASLRMAAAADALSVDPEARSGIEAFLDGTQARLMQIRAAFDARSGCAAPAQVVLLQSAMAGLVQQAHHVLNFAAAADVEVSDTVQEAGLCLQAAYFAETAGVEVLRALLTAEAAPAVAANSSGNMTITAAAHVDDIAVLPLLTASTRLLDVTGLLHTANSFAVVPAQRQLDALTQITMRAAIALLTSGGNTLALQAALNKTSAEWAASLSSVASSLAGASNALMLKHIEATAQDRRDAVRMVIAPVRCRS